MITRREFASSAIAAAIAGKAAAAAPGSPGEWRNKQSGMSYRQLGRTGFMISEMVMGGNTIAPANYEHVLLALDMGLNYLDTAPAYGNTKSELGYAEVIKARKRDSYFLNTKISVWDINRGKVYKDIFASLSEPEQKKLKHEAEDDLQSRRALDLNYYCNYFPAQVDEMRDAALANVMSKKYGRQLDRGKNFKQIIFDSFDESLKRLGTDHTDIVMCPHGASTPYELLNYPEIFEAFEQLRKAGKTRFLGVSAHNDPAGVLDAAVKAKIYSVAMVAFNIVNRPYTEAAVERAKKAGLGVIAMKVARPVHHGRSNGQPNDPARLKLINDAVPGDIKVPQKAYLWALRNPNLSAVISELINAGLVKDNLPLAAPKA
jgi:aryl-alcohol dehydrogenase-like predicted oxidoreductase